jgi:type IV pilus assembly protein PilC
MPTYRFRALTREGGEVRGERLAASAEALRTELMARGWLLGRARPVRRAGRWLGRRGVSWEALLLFNQELTALLRAGLSVPEALATTAERGDAGRLGPIVARVLDDVRGGERLSDACALHPDAFDEIYVSALRTGERAGDLPAALRRYQEDLRRRVAVRRKVSQALTYPLFLLFTLVVILGLLFAFVMPRFVALYAQFQADLPLGTRVLAGIVERLPLLAPLALGAGVALTLAGRLWLRSERGRRQWGALQQRLPGYGALHRAYLVAHTARTLGTLLGAGLPMTEALRTVQASIANRAYAHRLGQACDRVSGGQSLARALRAESLLPETGLKLVEAGEASGSLAEMLGEIARYYEEVLDHALGRAMALVEPALMLLMGILVGAIIVVMYLPIFQLADILQ